MSISSEKAVFVTHVDKNGRLKDGKERFDCVHCGGESYITDSSVTPVGVQHFDYKCTDCNEEWHESY